MVSIILNTINRYELTKFCVGNALRHAGSKYELLVCDNGSTDSRVVKYIESLNPSYFRKNKGNEGNNQMYNHLIKQTDKDVCIIDNDIALPQGWLAELIRMKDRLEKPGVLGIWCVEKFPEVENGVRPIPRVYGTRYIPRELINTIGYFCEEYGLYGLGDTDYDVRSHLAGFTNAYSANFTSSHLGDDIGERTSYRKMKTDQLKKYSKKLEENLINYRNGTCPLYRK